MEVLFNKHDVLSIATFFLFRGKQWAIDPHVSKISYNETRRLKLVELKPLASTMFIKKVVALVVSNTYISRSLKDLMRVTSVL